MRTIRALSTTLIVGVCITTLNASCSTKKDDTSLAGKGGSSNRATGGTGTSIDLTGGSAGSSAAGRSGAGGSSADGAAAGSAGDEQVGECSEVSGLGSCGGSRVEAELRTVNILLVIDKSGSMTDTLDGSDKGTEKWSALKSALGTALSEVKAKVNLGLVLYPYSYFHPIPENGCEPYCCDVSEGSSAVLVPVSPGTISVNEIGSQLDMTSPGGGTPTAAALASALDYFTNGEGSTLPGHNYVLLATDGGPNCNATLTCDADACTTNLDGNCDTSGNCCKDDNTHDLCLDADSVTAKLEALTAAGVSTFVVGLPGTQQYGQYLDAFADAGGVPDPTGDSHYYAVSEQNGVQGLVDVFESITTQLVHSCEVPLAEPPPKLTEVNVVVDCDAVPKMGADGSSWEFDHTPDPTSVILKGPVCDRLQESGAKRIDVVFGCPTVR